MKVAVLTGGTSEEREAGLWTAKFVTPELRRLGHEVDQFDIAESKWLEAVRQYDLAFNCLHGGGGENGEVQGALKSLGVPQTGSGVAASAVGMDKLIFKSFAVGLDVAVPQTVTDPQVGLFPLIAKRRAGGGSIGMSLLANAGELTDYRKATDDEDWFLEEFIPGIPVTIGVLVVDRKPLPLPAVDVILGEKTFYDQESKYEEGFIQLEPSAQDTSIIQEMVSTSMGVWRALGCGGYARFDFIVSPTRGPFLLEINTLPGLQEGSNFVYAASLAGIEYGDLLTRIMDSALDQSA